MAEGPRRLVLVGGGHAHVQVLRSLLMRPLRDVEVTLVVDTPVAIYSGMVPGFVAGQYATHEVEIDVRPLARRAGVRVVVAPMVGLDRAARRILVAGRPSVPYDVASLDVGSVVAGLDVPGVREHAVATRPIGALVRRLEGIFAEVRPQDRPFRLVVVGAGAAGVELAFCARERLVAAGLTAVDTTLASLADRPLAERSARVGRRILAAAKARGITFRGGVRVRAVHADRVEIEGGEPLPADLVLWVTGASGSPVLAATGLPLDDRGFLWVDPTLQVRGEPDLFAVGDCAVLGHWPEVPKAGVYAVREGPTLVTNLRRRLAGEPLRRYHPQRDYLMLLNLGDGTAIGTKWGLVLEHAAMFTWKDRIDRRFMETYQVLGPEGEPAAPFERVLPPMPEMDMVCGGCAAKVGEDALRAALDRLPTAPPDPEVVLGLAEADDAAAYREGNRLLVASVDAFPAFTDDPWLVGLVAAHNALGDLYAKGAAPRRAMAWVGVPEESDPDETLFQVLAGARAALDRAGVTLLGGHTTVGPMLTVGFWVGGLAEAPPWRASGLRAGDRLVLARGLGTGVLWHADAAGRATGRWIEAAVAAMRRGNGPASAAARTVGPSAATDVTGFGLAGHLGQMLRASERSAVVDLDRVPALPGALALLGAGERSTFHDQNRRALRALHVDQSARRVVLELIFDPQTAGGLLFGVAPEDAQRLVTALRDAGEAQAAVIGEVVPPREDGALFAVR